MALWIQIVILIKKILNLPKGSATPNKTKVGEITQEQLEEKTSQLDEIVEKLERHNERKEKLKQQLKVKELELDEIRKAYRYYTVFPIEK